MWILLARTREKCLWLWLVFSVLITILTLVQTISGHLGEAVLSAWLWNIIILYPGLTFLFIGLLLNRYPSKAVPRKLHVALWWFTCGYLFFALATRLAEPFVADTGMTIPAYLFESYQWLLPPNLLLLTGYYQAFIRRTAMFNPDQKNIFEVAAKEADGSEKKGDSLRSHCFQEIAAGRLGKVFDILLAHHQRNTQLCDHLMTLQAEYNTTTSNRDLNIMDQDEAQRQINRITLAVLNLIRQP